MLFFIPFVTYAADAVAVDDSGGVIAMLVGVLPSLATALPASFGLLFSCFYALAHIATMLPARLTDSWPSWLKSLVNLLAANYGKAKNRDG